MRARRSQLVLIAILAAAALLRFWGLRQEGLVDWDSAYYLGVAKTIRAALDWAWLRIWNAGAAGPLSAYLLEHGASFNPAGKHGFIVLLVMGSYLVGIQELLSLLVSAVAGVAGVYLAGRIAARIFDERAGLLAMLVLAGSFIHLHYSRSGQPLSVATTMLLLAWWCHLKSADGQGKRFTVFSGLAISAALTCHFNLIWVLGAFGLLFAAEAWQRQPGWGGRMARFATGVAAPLAVLQAITWAIKSAIMRSPDLAAAALGRLGIGQVSTWAEDVLTLTSSHRSGISEPDRLYFAWLVMRWEGLVALAALIVTLVWASRAAWIRRDQGIFSALVLTLTPIVFWAAFPAPMSRVYAAVPALASVLIGGWLVATHSWLAVRWQAAARMAAAATIALLVISGLAHGRTLLSVRSGMPEAIAFMRTQGSVRHVSSEFPLSRLYAGRSNVVDTRISFFEHDAKQVLTGCYRDGYRFLLLSGARTISDPELVQLVDGVTPVFRTPHSVRLTAYEYYERDAQRETLKLPEEIVVYEIKDVLGART